MKLRGVRQGDPLSPYLFIVAIEILAISSRTNKCIEGIKIGTDEIKSLFYADDMTATLANISSVEILIKILNDFEKCSGLKMNLSKTKAMWIGASKHSLEKPLGLEWCSGVKTLGIHFSCAPSVKFIKKTFITSFMTAPMRGPFGTPLIFGGLTSAGKILD